MKYILCMLCALALSLPAFCQIPKGTSIIGGSVAVNHSKTETETQETKSTQFDLSPSYGYFIISNLAIGASLDFSTASSSYNWGSGPRKSKSNSYGVGPFVRYYLPINEKLYGVGSVSYSREWSKDEAWSTTTPQNKNTTKEGYYNLGIGAGIAYFLTPNISLDVMLVYSKDQFKNREADDYTYRTSGIALAAGFNIFLRKN
jgi:outer membrane protein